MIINSYIFGSSYDPDAQAFITAANITDNTQKTAINQLVLDLKAYNIWSKMKAIYPFVGGTASTHKFNLKDPRDLDAAFRLVFNGGWTHSSTGALPNGTNAYADTKLVPSTSGLIFNSTHFSYYSRTNLSSASDDIGAFGGTSLMRMQIRGMLVDMYSTNSRISLTNSTSLGFWMPNRNSSSLLNVFRNGSIYASNSNLDTVSVLPNQRIFLASLNNNGGIAGAGNKQCAFATIGDGLTDTDATNLYNTVQMFQVALSRQV